MNYKIFILNIILFFGIMFSFSSCSNIEVEGDIYIAVPQSITFTSLEIQVYDESGMYVLNRYGIKNCRLNDQMTADIEKRFPDSHVMDDINSSDIYLTEMERSSDYRYDGTFIIHNNEEIAGEYHVDFHYGYMENDNVDFTLYNNNINEQDLKGFVVFQEYDVE